VQNIAVDAIDITNKFVRDKDTLVDVFENTTRDAGGDLCQGNSLIARLIRKEVGVLASQIDRVDALIDETLVSFGDDLQQVVTLLDGVDEKFDSTDIDIFLNIAIAVIVLLDSIIVAMLAVTCFSAKGVSNGCTKFVTHTIVSAAHGRGWWRSLVHR
jgi:hypothetical protein